MTIHQGTIYNHFSRIASFYRLIRTTDVQPIRYIGKKLKGSKAIRAADIGCGTGRYDLLLFRYLNNLHLTCIDINESMLKQTSAFLKGHGIHRFITVKAQAHDLPLRDNAMDCVFSFNAVHHFDFHRFIEKVAGVTREGGFVFIYTRLQSQNARNIWGRHFPLFIEKEKRLYELDDITEAVDSTRCSTIEDIKKFKFKRKATLDQLLDRVRKKHYSTFSLYSDHELRDCLKEFKKKIVHHFTDPDRIEWFDENTLIALRLRPKTI